MATALGLTAELTGDRELMDYARESLEDGLALQRPDGVNPERGGYDSSYQMTGVIYAARWVTYFPDDPLTPKVMEMIDKAVAWEATRILPTGEINSEGNTRTGGRETSRNGQLKSMNTREIIRGFAYWSSVTDNPMWEEMASQIAHFYYNDEQAFGGRFSPLQLLPVGSNSAIGIDLPKIEPSCLNATPASSNCWHNGYSEERKV